ncbi:S-ribosylhomocysteine lyase, partial [Staphylococcus epidermidis]
DNVPGVAEKECGNYRNHSLFGAKEWSKKILSEGISTDPYERKVI